MQEMQVQPLGLEDPLQEGIAAYSSILAWKIPWTEEPGRLQSMGSQRVGHDWETKHRTGHCYMSLGRSLPFFEPESCSVLSDFLWFMEYTVHSIQFNSIHSNWTIQSNSPGQNTGVGSLSLPQGIFPTQGSNPGVLHCRWILYQLSHKGSPLWAQSLTIKSTYLLRQLWDWSKMMFVKGLEWCQAHRYTP